MMVNIYLNFYGNTEEAFTFYKSVFGGEFIHVNRFKDMPNAQEIPESEKEKIMHMALPIGDHLLMGSDIPQSMEQTLIIGNNVSISLHPESEQEAEKLFQALSEEAKEIQMPLQKTFWNAYFGMLTDKFGIQWMINYEYNQEESV